MPDLACMEIAGVGFAIDSPIVIQEPESKYLSFYARGDKRRATPDLRIHLELGRVPSTDGLRKIFDSGQSWSLFIDGSTYYISCRPSTYEETLWLARYDREIAEVKVYCSEKYISESEGTLTVSNPVCYPLDQVLLMYFLARKQGALLHAAGIDIGGRGYIFPGKSGAGKSTIMRQFAVRKDIGLVSDDRMAVRKIKGAFTAHGTPWPGDAGIAMNASVSLSGIFFIIHGSANRIEEITTQEALERLLPVSSIPWYDREVMPRILDFCEDLIVHVPTYVFHFKPGAEVVDVFEEFVST